VVPIHQLRAMRWFGATEFALAPQENPVDVER